MSSICLLMLRITSCVLWLGISSRILWFIFTAYPIPLLSCYFPTRLNRCKDLSGIYSLPSLAEHIYNLTCAISTHGNFHKLNLFQLPRSPDRDCVSGLAMPSPLQAQLSRRNRILPGQGLPIYLRDSAGLGGEVRSHLCRATSS